MKILFTIKNYHRFLIDDEDFKKVSKYKWHSLTKNLGSSYIKTYINKKTIYLHRFILNYFGEFEIDHINRNKLDNQKSNLKISTTYDNRQVKNRYKHLSSGGYKGVIKNGGLWKAQISIKGKSISLGKFYSPSEAAKKYDEEVIKLNLSRPLNYQY